jgi:hypothetical protein
VGVIVGVGIIIASIFGAAISQQLSDEFNAWAPWLIERLIKRAVRGLAVEIRARYDEEWRSHVNETPGHFGKLIVACGYLVAAGRIKFAAQKKKTFFETYLISFVLFCARVLNGIELSFCRSRGRGLGRVLRRLSKSLVYLCMSLNMYITVEIATKPLRRKHEIASRL